MLKSLANISSYLNIVKILIGYRADKQENRTEERYSSMAGGDGTIVTKKLIG